MARLFTRREANDAGISDRQLDWAVRKKKLARLERGVYFEGDRLPTRFEHQLAKVISSKQIVKGNLAAALHGFDGLEKPSDGKYDNLSKTSAHETLISIASTTTDVTWEWALEWALRKRHTSIREIEAELAIHRYGNARIRRVLKLRPKGAPPTGSILETMAVQLIRRDSLLPTPSRQVQVRHWYVDLAWPEHGIFLELDGGQHKDQPQYDATRQNGVIAATGWLVGRYTWTDIVHNPNSTLRSIAALLNMRSAKR